MARRTSLPGGGHWTALRALCERPLLSRDLRVALRAPLRLLIDFDAYCVNTCDVETGVVTSSVGDGLSPEQARALFAIEAEGNDFNRLSEIHREPRGVRSLWASSAGALDASQRSREIFQPLGWGDELRAGLGVSGICYGYLHLFRHSERGPFRSAEIAQVERASALLGRALHRALAREARMAGSERARGPELLLLDQEQRAVRQSDGVPSLFTDLDSVASDDRLAHLVHDLTSRARWKRTAHATLVRKGRSPRTVSALQIGDETAIVIAQLSTEAADALTSSRAALTPRERDVSRLIVRGYSNLAIAAELGLTLYTVKDHVKAVLAKTGCSNRTELAACSVGK